MKKLRTLQIRAFGIPSTVWFDSFPRLETLDLQRGQPRHLPNSDIESLARLPNLHSLTLPNSPEVEQVALLRPLTRLRELKFPGYQKNSEQLKAALRHHLPRIDGSANYSMRLEQEIVVHCDRCPLNESLELLSNAYHISIHLDELSLDEIGVRTSEPVGAVLSGVSLRASLDRILSGFGLVAVPHDHGIIVTDREGNRVYRVHYDLTDLLRGVDAGDNLTVHLSQIIQKLISPNQWGRDFPVLPHSPVPTVGLVKAEEELATAEVVEAGTTLIVMANVKTHAAIRNFVNQVTQGEDSQLLDVEFRQLLESPLKSPNPETGKSVINFAEVPLIDGLEFVSRTVEHPIVVDTAGLEKIGIRPDHRINAVFEYTTLEECLDTLLDPLKLTWIFKDDVIKVLTQKDAAERPTIVVHQLFDDLIRPEGARTSEHWSQILDSICKQGTGLSNPRFEIWFGRLIVNEPWRNQLKLARLLRKLEPKRP